MKNASVLIILLPLLLTGASTGSGNSSPICDCPQEDTVKLKSLIHARVDSMIDTKVLALEHIKKDLLDSAKPPQTVLGHGAWTIDTVYELHGRMTIHKWYFKIRQGDTLFAGRRSFTTAR